LFFSFGGIVPEIGSVGFLFFFFYANAFGINVKDAS
jgi:hypothetical protein